SIDSSCEIYTVPLSGGPLHRVTKEDDGCSGLMWSPDGQSIVFSSFRSKQPSLWRISAKGGKMQRESLFPALGSFSKDGRRFVYSESTITEPPAIWRADLASAGGKVLSHKKLVSTQYPELDAQPSPDGNRIAWVSGRGGTPEIWVGDAEGQQ